jgi:hypothetical protein
VVEPCQQPVRRQQPDARRRQFDRQRQPVQPRADRGDGRRVVVGQREVRPDRPRALDEESDCLTGRDRIERAPGGWVGKDQRRDWEFLLAGDMQRPTASHKQGQPGRCSQQHRQPWANLNDLLQVIEHEQPVPIAQAGNHPLKNRDTAGLLDAQRLSDRWEHEFRISHRFQSDELNTPGTFGRQIVRNGQRQARLPDPSRPG